MFEDRRSNFGISAEPQSADPEGQGSQVPLRLRVDHAPSTGEMRNSTAWINKAFKQAAERSVSWNHRLNFCVSDSC